jgi:ribonuclease E
VAEDQAPATPAFVDTLPAVEATPGVPETGDREGARRRRRRGGRGRGRDEAGADGVTIDAEDSVASTQPIAVAYEPEAEAPAEEQRQAVAPMIELPETARAATPPTEAPITASQIESAAPRAAPAVAMTAAPIAATPYVLPTDTLDAIARDAGLQWVNSDADKIRAVQEAMAGEPKPIHVPRLPKPRVVVDEGPLVLVETKKDLSQIRLPFDPAPPSAP